MDTLPLERFRQLAAQAKAAATATVPDAGAFLYDWPGSERLAYDSAHLLSARRGLRSFQLSLREDLPRLEGFFKDTGVDFEIRLLQVTCPASGAELPAAIALFEAWIVDEQAEPQLAARCPGLG